MFICSAALCIAACTSKEESSSSGDETVTEAEEAETETETEAEETVTEAEANEENNTEAEAEDTAEAGETTESITADEALSAIKNYCYTQNPDLESMEESDEYTISWDVEVTESQIVVLYRSYTGAETRYYIDPSTGETYSTELVPGIIDEEERTDESFNIKDYL